MRKLRPPQALRHGDTVRVGATIYHMRPSKKGAQFDVFRNDMRIGSVTFTLGVVHASPDKNKSTAGELLEVAALLYDEHGNPT